MAIFEYVVRWIFPACWAIRASLDKKATKKKKKKKKKNTENGKM